VFRRISLPVVAIFGVVLLILMIGGVTVFASSVIGETVDEQLQSQQIQIANSAARQVEAYFTQLSIEGFQLSQDEAIRSIARSDDDESVNAIETSVIENDYFGIIESVVQLRIVETEPGELEQSVRYGWSSRVGRIRASDTLPYAFPQGVLQQLTAVEDTSEVVFYRLPSLNAEQDYAYIMFAPVETIVDTVEFLAYYLNIDAAIAEVLEEQNVLEDLAEIESGQVWFFDYEGDLFFQSGATLQSGNPSDVYTRTEIISFAETTVETFVLGDVEYNGTFVPVDILEQRFMLLVSQDAGAASDLVSSDLSLIFGVAVAAVLLLTGMSVFIVRQLLVEIQERQEQASIQRATRTLLEVSRALNSTLDFTQVLNEILTELKRIVPYQSAFIMLLNDRGELEVVAHKGGEEVHDAGVFSIEETSAAREVITSGKPVIIDDTSKDDRWAIMEDSPIKSWMGLPLRMREEFVGVLNINHNRPGGFKDDNIEMAEAFSDQASVALQNARLHDRDVTRIERELTLARSIQSSLLPAQDSFEITELAIAFESLPARQVSGDYFQLIPLPDRRYGIFVGDVSGKGMPAALIMAVITTALRDEVVRGEDPGLLLNRLNERLLERLLQVQMNSALIAAVFDSTTNEIAIANAGMVQPYWRNPGAYWDFVDIGGYPLGASQRTNYSYKMVKLEPGAMMVLFSDGIIEAQDSRGEFFGFDRLEALLEALPPDIDVFSARDRILQAVQRHLGNQDAQDDITVMVLRALEVEAVERSVETPALPHQALVQPEDQRNNAVVAVAPATATTTVTSAPSTIDRAPATITHVSPITELSDEDYIMPRENVEIFIPSILGFEKIARSAAEALARKMGFADEKIEDVKTAVAEAVMNAIEHGNLEDKATSVTVMFSASEEHLEIRVHDRGRQVVPNPLPPPGQGEGSRGWGIFFMQSLMDEFEISRSPEGNEIRMTVRVNENAPEDVEEADPAGDNAEWVDQGE
jgi:serine phosphatase RsbU (regulator of sigma subunit)/anti-sigma regulatory factor (Ser/Thr protein kinase)